jgi:electron transfer flavoprotein beta subunit
MGAKKKPHELLSIADLGLAASAVGEAGSRTRVLALAPPPEREPPTIIDGGEGLAERVLEYLVAQRLL